MKVWRVIADEFNEIVDVASLGSEDGCEAFEVIRKSEYDKAIQALKQIVGCTHDAVEAGLYPPVVEYKIAKKALEELCEKS